MYVYISVTYPHLLSVNFKAIIPQHEVMSSAFFVLDAQFIYRQQTIDNNFIVTNIINTNGYDLMVNAKKKQEKFVQQ